MTQCTMEGDCLWQTCQVGSPDSCWWTVNCDANEDCQVSCTPCFNLQCPGCQSSWDGGCKPGFEGQKIYACPADPALGKDCGILFCRKPDEIEGGKWVCPGDEPDAGRIE